MTPLLHARRRQPIVVAIDRRPADDGAKDTPPASKVSVPGVPTTETIAGLAAGFEAIRSKLRAYGAALAAGAGAVLTGVGYSTFNSLFPLPTPYIPLLSLLGSIAIVLALGGLGYFVTRIFAAQRQLLLVPSEFAVSSDRVPSEQVADRSERRRFLRALDLSETEAALVGRVLQEHAAEQQVVDMRTLELRALRLDRVHRRLAVEGRSSQADALATEAARLNDVVSLATTRAGLAVLQRRSNTVFRGVRMQAALAAALVGIVGLLVLADFSKGQRDLIDLRSACAKAVLADHATQACDPVNPTSTTPTPPAPSTDVRPDVVLSCAAALPTTGPSALPSDVRGTAILACAGIAPSSS